MKSILLSTHPKHIISKINGLKKIEIRKTKPKELPFKVYEYCTKARNTLYRAQNGSHAMTGYEVKGEIRAFYGDKEVTLPQLNGKVVLEYVVREVSDYNIAGLDFFGMKDILLENACLTHSSLEKYAGSESKEFFGWHISDLKIYDEPLELGEFLKPDTSCGFYNPDLERCDSGYNCERCAYNDLTVTRPPQSYMFVRRR